MSGFSLPRSAHADPRRVRPWASPAGVWTAAALLALEPLSSRAPYAQQPADSGPPARELLRTLAARPRVAGTPQSLQAVEFLASELEHAGLRVEREEFRVLLSLPRRIEFAICAATPPSDARASSVHGSAPETALVQAEPAQAVLVQRVETWDADAAEPGDIPKFAGWTASGKVRAPVVHVGRGLRDDYRRLAASGVDVRGAIALAAYGGAYRGIKVDLAAEHGCVGVLLYSSSDEDGAARGDVWPKGPWKPGYDAQRGSISPMGRAPGDPTTPGWPSSDGCARVPLERVAVPSLPCLPIGWDDARVILEHLRESPSSAATSNATTARATPPSATTPGADSKPASPTRVGPGPVEVVLDIDAPLELRTIVNVIGTLAARASETSTTNELVVAGSHRDSWVRGANDSGGGCIALLRAAQRLGARHAAGWTPHAEIRVCFWDAEEQGLIGSTEHVEAHAADLAARLVAYVNSDANVSGPRFGASGTPGCMRVLQRAMSAVDSLATPGQSLWAEYTQNGQRERTFGLPGSGSDFAAFVHHLGLPMLELGFHGNDGGQYHTTFDDFEMVERYLDPGFAAHEKAGEAIAALLAELAEQGRACFDAAEAARELARHARLAGLEKDGGGAAWLGVERAEALALEFDALARASAATVEHGSGDHGSEDGSLDGRARSTRSFYAALCVPEGLPGRPWFRNALWAPGLETGYSSETWPTLRAAARAGDAELARALDALCARVHALAATDAASRDSHAPTALDKAGHASSTSGAGH